MSNNISWLGNKVVDPNSLSNSINATVLKQSTTNDQAKIPASQQNANPSASTIQQQPYMPMQPVTPPVMPPLQPTYPPDQQGPPPVTDVGYVPAYLAKNIGRDVRAEFIINNAYLDKSGRLIEVGINYFVLYDVNSRTNIMCDLYSVRFVTVLQP
jgi:hypothetical protein